MADFDAIIIGAGIAGASLAWELSNSLDIALVERESFGGTQSTGRSAALYIHPYGTPTMSALARASLPFLLDPPSGFAETPLLHPRPLVLIARADQLAATGALKAQFTAAGKRYRQLDGADAAARWPILDAAYLAGGRAVLDEEAFDIDVHALHSAYLRGFRARGGSYSTDAGVTACKRRGEEWTVRVGGRDITANLVINAAGAWADEVADMAGVRPLGLEARRRTMVMLPPIDREIAASPCFVDAEEHFYFKPEGESLLVSPGDATPDAPGDVQPDEYDVATAIDRLERATGMRVRTIARKWAGLRTFAADEDPVIGWDRTTKGFFWLAGQGGAGIMTSPAIARLAASLVLDIPLPADLEGIAKLADRVSPARFAR